MLFDKIQKLYPIHTYNTMRRVIVSVCNLCTHPYAHISQQHWADSVQKQATAQW